MIHSFTKLFCLTILCSTCVAQNSFYFNKIFELEGGSYITPLIDTINNGYLIISSEYNIDITKSIKLQKVDTLGNIEWYSQLDSVDYNLALLSHDLIKTHDGNYFIYYPKPSLAEYNDDIRLVKVTPDGEILWKKTIGDEAHEFILQAISTSDNGFLLIGGSQILDPFEYGKSYVVKLDSLGDLEWRRTYLLGIDRNIACTGLEAVDGGYVIGALGKVNGEDMDMLWFKVDDMGNFLWEKNYDGSDQDDCNMYLCPYVDDTYLLTGCINEGYERTPYVAKLDSNFDIVWDSIYYTPYSGHYLKRYPVIKENGDFVIIGSHKLLGNIGQPLLMSFDKDGDILWTKEVTIDTTLSVAFETVKPTKDGGYVFTGYRSIVSQIGWLLKTDSLGNTCSYIGCDSIGMINTSIEPSLVVYPYEVKVAPNPARNYVLVQHDIPDWFDTPIFQISNLQGQVLLEQSINKPLFFHKVSLNNMPIGIYFYTLYEQSSGSVYQSGKLVVH